MNKKIVLIDGNSILNRAFYGIPVLTNSKGQHTNAVYGFLNILFKILEEETAEYLTVAFDLKHPTFRHEMYQEYKGTRKPMPEELVEQVPLIKEVLKSMNITIIEKAGFEADDILGTIARMAEKEGYVVSLVSGDRDLLQLATDKIKIRIPKTKKGGTEIEDYYETDVIEKYGINPVQIIDLKGLMGDTSDNIPGVPGIGEKTATKIISQYGTVENAIEHVDEIMPKKAKENLAEYKDLAILSKTLATIKTDCVLDYQVESSFMNNLFNEEAYKIMKNLEFKSLLAKFEVNTHSNQALESQFQMVTDIKMATPIFTEIEKCIQEKKVIGLHWVLGNGDNIHSQENINAEGQYTLFSAKENEKSCKNLVALAVSYQLQEDRTVYFDIKNDLTESILIEEVSNWLQKGAIFSVLDLKNILHDTEGLKEFNWNTKSNMFDCSIAAYLLNPLKESYLHDDIARDYLEMAIPSYKDLFGKLLILEATQEKKETFFQYCCTSAYVAFMAYEKLIKKLEETQMLALFQEVEMPLVYALFDMEGSGIRVNKEELKQYGESLGKKIETIEKEIYDLVGESFNINSPKQLGIILFEKMQLPFAKKTKTGYSTSAEILEKLKDEYPVVAKILEYRQFTKLKSTYADGLANYIDSKDNRIHGTFNQTITATGRLSSTEPNLQNIPIRMELGRQLRKVFIPEENYIFLDADYSQIELRILAHMSGDQHLIEAYKSNQDIHKITASEVFHTPLEEVTSLQRSNAKAVNFGIVYGISSFGLGQDLNISKKEAEGYIQKYFETYPNVKIFLDELVECGKTKGYVTSLLNRRRPVPELSSSNFMQRSFGERIAMNSPVQGTAADIIKIAMVRVHERLKEQKLKSRLILQVHDELLVETHINEIQQVKEILEEEMFHAIELDIPLEIDIKQGNNWYEAH